MLITQKMGVRGSRTQNIVNVPLPSHQATKILQELQTSCNSPNKATQVEALKCWGVWIQSRGPEEWEDDSVCHFAVKPLTTKKLQALHKDGDICKLKLSLLWKVLSQVQGKMELKGSQHILKIFLQACFAWLSSIDTFDNKIIVLIIKLLLSLFQKFESPVMCDTYTFSPIQIDISILRKLLLIFNDNILDVFDYWKKVHDNDLIMKFWTCFLEYCECGHENITTSVWHRIFKVNQTFCLDHSESAKDRLMFLHACATNVKTVLLSSKYIGGESCFTTPCEALMKKLVEVCSTEVEEVPDSDMFSLCKDVSQVLGNESIVISDYDICIYLLDSLEDFVYKSFLWGAWCGLVDCFKKNLLSLELQMFTRKQSKFYRKLRGVIVNFELDKVHLTSDSVALVESSIEILKVGCFCGPKTPKFTMTNSPQKDENVLPFESMEVGDENLSNESLPPVNLQIVKKALSLTPGGHFGSFPICTVPKKPPPVLHFNFEFVKNFFELLKPQFHVPFLMFNNIKAEFTLVQGQSCLSESKVNLKMITYNECESPRLLRSSSNKDSKESEIKEKKEIAIPKTRGRKRKGEKEIGDTIGKKRRKSFEVLVQEIVTKNKLRKSAKNTKSKKPNVSEKKELRSRKQLKDMEEEEVPKKQLRERKRAEEKSPKRVNNGKLDNFFKVIDSKPNTDKTKKAKKVKGKKEKSEINWKQPSLTGMISSKTIKKGETNPKTQAKIANKKLKSTPEKKVVQPNNQNTTSPFKEALQDHEYAKSMESPMSSSTDKQSKKPVKCKKPRRKGKVTDTEVKEVETSILEKAEEQTVQNDVVEISTPEKLKIEIDEDVNLVESKEEIIEIKETKKFECDDVLGTHLEDGKNEQIKSGCNIETIENENPLQVNSPDKSVTSEVCDTNKPVENISPEAEEKESEDEGLYENLEKMEPAFKNIKKRMPLIYSPRPRKRAKLNEDSLEGGGCSMEDVAEKENVESLQLEKIREILSPIKESLAESSASKEEISPNKKSPSLNRTTSSRVLRMMALIPEPTSPVGNQTSYEAASKTGSKHHCKKYIGVDKSSRVSKMLARLSESMKQAEEDLTNGKLKSEEDSPPPVSTPKSHNLIAKNISPKPIKKKKFIGFDDSKNETIVFQTDKPPSQILEQRILLRDG